MTVTVRRLTTYARYTSLLSQLMSVYRSHKPAAPGSVQLKHFIYVLLFVHRWAVIARHWRNHGRVMSFGAGRFSFFSTASFTSSTMSFLSMLSRASISLSTVASFRLLRHHVIRHCRFRVWGSEPCCLLRVSNWSSDKPSWRKKGRFPCTVSFSATINTMSLSMSAKGNTTHESDSVKNKPLYI